jgi:hypothetical protein
MARPMQSKPTRLNQKMTVNVRKSLNSENKRNGEFLNPACWLEIPVAANVCRRLD